MSRDRTVMMSRIMNEARWIRRNLERTFLVAQTVVLWDDGSTDATEAECREALGSERSERANSWGWIGLGAGPEGPRILHFLRSPFTDAARSKQRTNEIRDKNCLWEYCKAAVDFDYCLCLDGDEMLSLEAVRTFHKAIALLKNDHDILTLPFVYVWDAENLQRIDGIYGNASDGLKQLRFPRLFTIKRVSEQALFDTRFAWQGTRGGFHCGSIPREAFGRSDGTFRGGLFSAPIVHMGYIDDSIRRKKFEFYNTIDPNNEAEGCYRHIIGQPDCHASGPVQLASWSDD